MTTKFSIREHIGFNYRNKTFTLRTHELSGKRLLTASADNDRDQIKLVAAVDKYLSRFAPKGGATEAERIELGAAIQEPILQVVQYMEMYGMFYVPQTFDDFEDNKIAVEDITAMAWETHPASQVLYTQPGYSFTRPNFTQFDTGVEINWSLMAKAGWNVLARAMSRAAEALARKRDQLAYGTLRTALAALPSHGYNVTGGKLTKAIVDTVLRDQASIGFPITQVIINPGRLMDMGDFNWGGTNMMMPPEEVKQLLRTLFIMDYGGASWYTNVNAPTSEVILSGPNTMIGYHQIRGEVKTMSDVDMTQKVDRHAIYDQEHAFYIVNSYPLSRITIGA